MIFESKWKQFLLLENIEEVYQKIIKKNPERKQIWDRFKSGIEQKVRSPILAGQYLQWAFTQIANPQKYNEIVVDGNMSKEDMIMEAINLFEDNKSRISGSKSILDYDWSGVRTALGNIESSKREKKLQKKETAADVLYEDNRVSVIYIKTKEASCEYGAGTQWCTAATQGGNMFDSYNRNNNLIIIASKNNPENKFQLAIGKNSGVVNHAMDASDSPINVGELVKVFGIQRTKEILRNLPLRADSAKQIMFFEKWYEKEISTRSAERQFISWLQDICSFQNRGMHYSSDDEDYYKERTTYFWDIKNVKAFDVHDPIIYVSFSGFEDSVNETNEEKRRSIFFKRLTERPDAEVNFIGNIQKYLNNNNIKFIQVDIPQSYSGEVENIRIKIYMQDFPGLIEAKEMFQEIVSLAKAKKTKEQVYRESAEDWEVINCKGITTYGVSGNNMKTRILILSDLVVKFPDESGKSFDKDLWNFFQEAVVNKEKYSWLWKDYSLFTINEAFNFLEKLKNHIKSGNTDPLINEKLVKQKIIIKIKTS